MASASAQAGSRPVQSPPTAATSSTVRFLDVPYIQQSEALCGGAAAAMVMRYWGAADVYAESFASLVDKAAGGIRAQDLLDELRARGWDARSFRGDAGLVQARLGDRQPTVALIEDRPGAFHFVVVVAWTNGRVVYHDPARAPFQVVPQGTFEAAWQKAGHWTMLALPPKGEAPRTPPPDSPDPRSPLSVTPCAALLEEGMRAGQAGQRGRALEVLSSAAELCPGDSAPLREAAGVHALAGDWRAAADTARAAVSRNAADQHAWRILATSAYVSGDTTAALAAWNAVGEPRVDLVTVQGLSRTRHSVVSALIDLPPGTTLTTERYAAASRRVAELPAAEAARVRYTPRADGRADVEATVLERPRLPATAGAWAGIGIHALAERELAASAASLTGGGERITAAWRWWEARPRLAVALAAPSRVGVWRADVYGEKQTYGTAGGITTESRRGGALSVSNWTSRLLRWEAGVGLDAWSAGRTAVLSGSVQQRLGRDSVAVEARATQLLGAFSAWTSDVGADWRSRQAAEGLVVAAGARVQLASRRAPLALWPGAGTGHARGPLLRAHPLLDDGTITGDVFGRRVYHASAEARHWLPPVFRVIRIAPAAFLDVARAERRLAAGDAWHADAGVGLRVGLGGASALRLDLGKGLRDGATALSIGWTSR